MASWRINVMERYCHQERPCVMSSLSCEFRASQLGPFLMTDMHFLFNNIKLCIIFPTLPLHIFLVFKFHFRDVVAVFFSNFSGVCGLKFHPSVRFLFHIMLVISKTNFHEHNFKVLSFTWVYWKIWWIQTYFVLSVLSISEIPIYCLLLIPMADPM